MSSPSSPVLQRLFRLDRSSPDFHDQLEDVLYGPEYVQCEQTLEGDDPVWLIDYLEEVLGSLDPSSSASRKCLRELRSICGTKARLPASYYLPLSLPKIDDLPLANGASCDVYRVKLPGSKLCVKRVRVAQNIQQEMVKDFCKEAVIWKHLKHPNVLPLLGVTTTPFQLISKWVSGGHLLGYVQKHPDADQMKLLSDITKGLIYLHSRNVIHGDLKGPNILVEKSGHIWIADFGLSKITKNPVSVRNASCQSGFSMRWAAPEVLNKQDYSKKADVFSLAMVMIETFTREVPFSGDSQLMAMMAIARGDRPLRPPHPTFTVNWWKLTRRCWNDDPHLRPEASEVLETLLTLGPPAWKQLVSYPSSTEERTALIASIFSDSDEVEMVGHLSGGDAQTFIDAVDETLDNLSPEIRRRCLHYLSGICGRQNLLPRSLPIPLFCDLTETPQYAGEFGDVWKGQYNGQEVAAKVLRVQTSDLERIRKRFCKEVVIRKSLHHPNVLPLLGTTVTGDRLVMVLEWMGNGNINEFVRAYPDANRLELLADVDKGLIYLHDQGIVHGNIKGSNVLIDKTGCAVLAGFSLLAIIPDELIVTPSDLPGGTTRRAGSMWWSASEILEGGAYGKEADIYSFAMLMIEVFTGMVPFSTCPSSVTILAITQGTRPPRPTHPSVTGRLWKLIQQCWDHDPHLRPEASGVLQILLDSNPPAWKRLIDPVLSAKERVGLIMAIFSDPDEVEVFKYLSGTDAQEFVDVVDEVLDTLDDPPQEICGGSPCPLDGLNPSGLAAQKCLHELRNMCGIKAILPTSYSLSSDLLSISSNTIASGDYDVYEGTYNSLDVCIKRLRVYARDRPQVTAKAIYREAVLWKHLAHPNILPFLGVTTDPLQLILDRMPGGTLPEYIKDNPDADRLRLLSDVASGLCYLHSRDVIHGDLKGSNVVVDADGHARITDFRFATVAADADSEQTTPDKHFESRQWPALEILVGGAASKETDIFSFAMVMIEAFTATIPLGNTQPIMTMTDIEEGKRPSRPAHPDVTGALWKLIKRCWDEDPCSRPEASEVLQILLDSNPPTWKQLTDPTLSMEERIDMITSIFSDRDEVEAFRYLSGCDAQAFVDMIDETLGNSDNFSEIHNTCLRSSYEICRREALLPRALQIPLCYDPTENPMCHGGIADVWKGNYDGRVVAAKALRLYQTSDLERTREWFCKEVVIWKMLRHPNVLQLLGATMSENPHRFVMVSEWMGNGNINKFVKANYGANRLKLLADATKGLIYLHDQGVIHGDLNGANIMIHDDGHALLTDFSLLTLIPDQSTFLSTCLQGGKIQWMSPELIEPKRIGLEMSRPTKESDCYAMGMTVYEVISERVPFDTNNPLAVVSKVLNGERPERPRGEVGRRFTEDIWDLVQRCWKAGPGERPSARDILRCLEGGTRNVDGDNEWSDAASTDSQYFSDEWDPAESNSDSPIVPDESGPLVLPLDSPPSVPPIPVIPRDDGQSPDPPQPPNPEGRIGDWLTLIFWYILNALIGWIHILWRARR